ncbi:MAG TPA: 50S ribosomal protein L23 [Candidatus Polarisedimenticolia bacterium]|jgi:large subunit ribosomal protein L23|nr:50S ribosomal protein L23 [Candidatus Polarisedimenticolia bacterium]
MSRPQDVLIGPLITEKTSILKERGNVLTFKVDRRANKIEVRKAVEALFKVKVESVRTEHVHGKVKRVGRFSGKRPDWKKAYVTLKPGEKTIEYFEVV